VIMMMRLQRLCCGKSNHLQHLVLLITVLYQLHRMPAFQVKTDEKSVADNNIENNMEVLLMSKKKRKPNPETWKRNVAKDQLNKGLAYNSTLGIEMPAKSMKEPCSLKCMQRCREKI
jgi:hypothetical protein